MNKEFFCKYNNTPVMIVSEHATTSTVMVLESLRIPLASESWLLFLCSISNSDRGDVLEHALQFWEKRGVTLSPDDCREMINSMSGYVSLLDTWDQKQRFTVMH